MIQKIFILLIVLNSSYIYTRQCSSIKDLTELVGQIGNGKQVSFTIRSGESISGDIVNTYNLNGKKIISIKNSQGIIENHHIADIKPITFKVLQSTPSRRIEPAILIPPDQIPPTVVAQLRGDKSPIVSTSQRRISPLSIPAPKVRPLKGAKAPATLKPSRVQASKVALIEPIDSVEVAGKRYFSTGDERFVSISTKLDGRLPAEIVSIKRDRISGVGFAEIEVYNPRTYKLERKIINLEDLSQTRISSTSKRVFSDPITVQIRRRQNASSIFGKKPPYRSIDFRARPSKNLVPVSGEKKVMLVRDGKQYSIAKSEGRIFDDIPIEQLPKDQSYTFVITEGGEVSFGKVEDAWEVGVKHGNIARGRKVIAAGELKIGPGGKAVFNMESGTFTKPIVRGNPGVTNESLAEKVKAFFKKEGKELEYVKGGLFPKNAPSQARIDRLCQNPAFKTGGLCICPNPPADYNEVLKLMCK